MQIKIQKTIINEREFIHYSLLSIQSDARTQENVAKDVNIGLLDKRKGAASSAPAIGSLYY